MESERGEGGIGPKVRSQYLCILSFIGIVTVSCPGKREPRRRSLRTDLYVWTAWIVGGMYGVYV